MRTPLPQPSRRRLVLFLLCLFPLVASVPELVVDFYIHCNSVFSHVCRFVLNVHCPDEELTVLFEAWIPENPQHQLLNLTHHAREVGGCHGGRFAPSSNITENDFGNLYFKRAGEVYVPCTNMSSIRVVGTVNGKDPHHPLPVLVGEERNWTWSHLLVIPINVVVVFFVLVLLDRHRLRAALKKVSEETRKRKERLPHHAKIAAEKETVQVHRVAGGMAQIFL